ELQRRTMQDLGLGDEVSLSGLTEQHAVADETVEGLPRRHPAHLETGGELCFGWQLRRGAERARVVETTEFFLDLDVERHRRRAHDLGLDPRLLLDRRSLCH